jgi:hypothetical protein
VHRAKPFLKVLIAGALAGLVMSLVFLAFDLFGVFHTLGISMSVPPDLGRWMVIKVVEGALFCLLFLVPLLADSRHWERGLVVSIFYSAKVLVWDYPTQGIGFFGVRLGWEIPFVAIAFYLFWGVVAGLLLERFGLVLRAPEVEEPPPAA